MKILSSSRNLCLTLLALSWQVCATHAEPTPTPTPTNGLIAFASTRDGNYEIYVMNQDGSNQTGIRGNFADDFRPAWSPDGTKIAFVNNANANDEIYVMNADGFN